MRMLIAFLAALLLTACSTPTPTTAPAKAQTMAEWKRDAADEVHTTGEALTTLATSMKAFDLPKMRVDCAHLRSTVDKLERTLPSPYPQVNDALHDSIDDFRSLSQLCMTINPASTDEMTAMGQLVDSGGKHLTDALDLMNMNTPGW